MNMAFKNQIQIFIKIGIGLGKFLGIVGERLLVVRLLGNLSFRTTSRRVPSHIVGARMKVSNWEQ